MYYKVMMSPPPLPHPYPSLRLLPHCLPILIFNEVQYISAPPYPHSLHPITPPPSSPLPSTVAVSYRSSPTHSLHPQPLPSSVAVNYRSAHPPHPQPLPSTVAVSYRSAPLHPLTLLTHPSLPQ